MKAYRQKINELQRQIEEKAKELGQVSSMVEELTRQRNALGLSISGAEEEFRLLHHEKGRIEEEISAANERLIRAVDPKKAKIKTLEEAVEYLNSLLEIKKEGFAEVEVIKKQIETLKAVREQLRVSYQAISGKNEQALGKLSKVVRETEKEMEKQKKINEQIEGQKQALNYQFAGVQKCQEDLKFYARRLYKYYTEKKLGFPQELLEGVSPLKYFPSRNLQEKLRIKKLTKTLS